MRTQDGEAWRAGSCVPGSRPFVPPPAGRCEGLQTSDGARDHVTLQGPASKRQERFPDPDWPSQLCVLGGGPALGVRDTGHRGERAHPGSSGDGGERE